MRDRVAEVLAQRAALDRGAAVGITLSVLLHVALVGLVVYVAFHAKPVVPASFVSINFVPMQAPQPSRSAAPRTTKTETPKPAVTQPKLEEPKQRIEAPTPVVEPPKTKPEKNTVPLSPFGQSTTKGSENAPPAKPTPAPAPSVAPGIGTTTADVPVGGTGVAGVEGGDFPYAIYLQAMNRKIGGVWARPKVTPGTACIIYFRILSDGRIVDEKVETPSGNDTFDRSAVSALRSASPLNQLPYGYSGNSLGIRLIFK